MTMTPRERLDAFIRNTLGPTGLIAPAPEDHAAFEQIAGPFDPDAPGGWPLAHPGVFIVDGRYIAGLGLAPRILDDVPVRSPHDPDEVHTVLWIREIPDDHPWKGYPAESTEPPC